MTSTTEDLDVCNCSALLGSCLDIATPVNAKLSAYYKRSFANHTVKERLPVILTKLIDCLVRNKHDILDVYGTDSLEELKGAIGEISKLKHDIQTNKQIPQLGLKHPDAREYNSFIKKELDQNCTCTYFNSIWLFVECFMYRKVAEIFLDTKNLQEFDYFGKQKEEAFDAALPLIISLGNKIVNITEGISRDGEAADRDLLKNEFFSLLKLNLWGNKCDLSITAGRISDTTTKDLNNSNINTMDENILCDHSEDIYGAICRQTMFEIIDFVCDNAGYEIFTDMCMADYLITHQFAKQIRFFVKIFPWFISDVTKRDVRWLLERLSASDEEGLRKLGQRWSRFIDEKLWTIEESYFWTTYLPFSEMFDKDEALFRKLSKSKCTFYKGDLNYRKLLGDRNWDPVTPFQEALEGFHPSRLCTLRTLKADLICGLREGLANEMEQKDKEWLISGTYGVIQYCGKVKKLI